MSEKLVGILQSKFVDLAVKISVPALIGVSSYLSTFILDISTRLVVVESTRFTSVDGQRLEDKIIEHESQLRLLDNNQKRVVTTLDKVVDNQTTMLQTVTRIEVGLQDLQKKVN